MTSGDDRHRPFRLQCLAHDLQLLPHRPLLAPTNLPAPRSCPRTLLCRSVHLSSTRALLLVPIYLQVGHILHDPGTAAYAAIATRLPTSMRPSDNNVPAIKANPATGAGFVRRSSWLSHTWCGPLRAGGRAIGYCVTETTLRPSEPASNWHPTGALRRYSRRLPPAVIRCRMARPRLRTVNRCTATQPRMGTRRVPDDPGGPSDLISPLRLAKLAA